MTSLAWISGSESEHAAKISSFAVSSHKRELPFMRFSQTFALLATKVDSNRAQINFIQFKFILTHVFRITNVEKGFELDFNWHNLYLLRVFALSVATCERGFTRVPHIRDSKEGKERADFKRHVNMHINPLTSWGTALRQWHAKTHVCRPRMAACVFENFCSKFQNRILFLHILFTINI